MATKRKSRGLSAPKLFLLSSITGATVALGFLLASGYQPGPDSAPVMDSRIVEAASNGDLELVSRLLDEGISPDSAYGDGSRALHWAAQQDDLAMAGVLLARGAQVDITNDLGVAPLWLAAENGSDRFATVLLTAGADPNQRLPSGETPLMMAARSGNARLVQLLLERGADVNAAEQAQQQTALMWAAAQRHGDAVAVLLDHGADLNARSTTWAEVVQPAGAPSARRDALYEVIQGGFSALLFAAQQGDIESARHLLAAGADVNDQAADGSTALVIAAHSGHGEFARFLLEQGADPNLAGAGYSALHVAIPHQDLALVKALLDHGADVNATVLSPTPARRDSRDFALRLQVVGTTPLWIATMYRQRDILQALIAAGADTGFTTESEDSLLMLAIDGREAFFEEETRGISDPGEQESRALALIDYALELGVDINARNRNGDTALHKAAGRGFNTIVGFLAEHGAELEMENKRGLTPLATAMRLRVRGIGQSATSNDETVELLRRLGATR